MRNFQTPILFIVFNRPDRTSKVFEEIRKVRPAKLFVSADGPRKNVSSDIQLCRETRDIVKKVDWQCRVYTHFSQKNLGVKMGVVNAIDWFFDHVDEGIILEDDCLPNASFFKFLETMLAKYRNDDRIVQVCGTNAMGEWKSLSQSYFFSYYGSIWGWATWKRAWALNDITMKLWQRNDSREAVRSVVGGGLQYVYRKNIYDITYRGKVDAWSYAWSFARVINSGLSIVPAVNLIKNLGFGSESSNTKSSKNAFSELVRRDMRFPLKDPQYIVADRQFDWQYFLKLAVYSRVYSVINLPWIIASKIKKKLS